RVNLLVAAAGDRNPKDGGRVRVAVGVDPVDVGPISRDAVGVMGAGQHGCRSTRHADLEDILSIEAAALAVEPRQVETADAVGGDVLGPRQLRVGGKERHGGQRAVLQRLDQKPKVLMGGPAALTTCRGGPSSNVTTKPGQHGKVPQQGSALVS